LGFWKREAVRWLKQADYDLREAERALRAGSYSYACFLSHQSAEKAAKAVCYMKGEPTYGHDVAVLLEGLKRHGVRVDDLIGLGMHLNKFYAPTRYPNLHPSMEEAPFELYSKGDAETCVEYAAEILRRLREEIER
jgi:HEPN domain-containing protein